VAKLALLTIAAAALTGCKHLDDPVSPVSFSLVDPSERHPILVSQEPASLSVKIPRGSSGLTSGQRASLAHFLGRYRATDAGNSKLVIQAPSGGENEVASMQAVGEIRQVMSDYGFQESSVAVEAFQAERHSQPAIRISYLRYVAQGPSCGRWPENLARDPYNLPYANFGCATQANFAAQVANPADLLGPRTMTQRASERRDAGWEKYVKGEVTAAKKAEDEKIKTDGK
jgi:pilus assembly protein CpaD